MLIYHYTFLFHIFSLLTIHFSLITIHFSLITIPYFTMTSIGFCRVRVRPSGPTTVTREI